MKTNEIIAKIASSHIITEREISLLKRRANNGEDINGIYDIMDNADIEVTDEQSAKGFAWLWNLYKTPLRKERKHNPFGYREMDILENYKGERFTFRGFYDTGNRRFQNLLPIYEIGGMEYYVYNGEINIIG